MSCLPYTDYKDSGIKWLGAMPSHWGLVPIKHLVRFFSGGTPSKENEDYWGGEIPWASAKDMKVDVLSDTEDHITDFAVKQGAVTLLDGGAVLIVVRGMILARTFPVCLTHAPMAINQDLKGLVAGPRVLQEFLAWYLRGTTDESLRRLDEAGHGTKALRMDAWSSLPVALPPLPEQAAITAFLNRETARIDNLVVRQEKLIDLLKEKRQAVISHAVTKGLDPNVPMKDSGVEWLGEVPEHWEVGAVKRFFSVLDSRRVPLSAEERGGRSGEFPYYGASGVIDWIDDYIFDEDLVLVSEDGANLLNRSTPIAFVATGRYWVNNHAHILKPPDDALSFWAERIESIDLVPFITGSAQPKLTIDALANIPIAVPPTPDERALIQGYIQAETNGIDALITEAQSAINLLKERRFALISATVTGKIDVRRLVGDFFPTSEALESA